MVINILYFLSGIGVFLFGLIFLNNNIIDKGIHILKTKLNRILSNGFLATTLGCGITTIVQSSTATNCFAINMADKDIIDFKSAFFLMMGANIGTTITAYLAILAKFNLSNIVSSLIFVSMMMYMVSRNKNIKNIAIILSCISLIFVGLSIVNHSIVPLKDMIYMMLMKQTSNFMLFIYAMTLTAIFQSSSLTSVLLISLASYNLIDIEAAMIMVMGINLGSCFTIILATIGSSIKGWKVAFFQFFFNIIGILINLFLLYTGLLNFLVNMKANLDIKIALYHTIFNVSTMLFVFYFIPEIAKLLSEEKYFIKKLAI